MDTTKDQQQARGEAAAKEHLNGQQAKAEIWLIFTRPHVLMQH